MADVETISRQALADVQQTILGDRPETLEEELERARTTLRTAGILLECQREPLVVDAVQESILGFALREAVTNIVRHAHATRCRIRLQQSENGCVLEVQDDGCGDAHAVLATVQRPTSAAAVRIEGEGEGLRGMRERVEAIGGSVRREVSAGTRVLIRSADAGGRPHEPDVSSHGSSERAGTGALVAHGVLGVRAVDPERAGPARRCVALRMVDGAARRGCICHSVRSGGFSWQRHRPFLWVFGLLVALGIGYTPVVFSGTIFFALAAHMLPWAVGGNVLRSALYGAVLMGVMMLGYWLMPEYQLRWINLALYFALTIVGQVWVVRLCVNLRRLAAGAERERIADDLHDLLGDALSRITLKAQFAGQLLDEHGDCPRARSEIAGTERICREALADVRKTIRKYREESRAEQRQADVAT